MDFFATSDLHGYLPIIYRPFDLLMICGDICPARNHNLDFQESWIKNEFVGWVSRLPYKTPFSRVIITWGNHDFIGEKLNPKQVKEIEDMTGGRLVILNHESYQFEFPVSDGIDALNIFGTPYCAKFYDWAFMLDNESLDKKFQQIPEDTDILLTHDSPNIYGLGSINEGRWQSDITGNAVLAQHIERVKPMIYHCGHFHSGNHIFEQRDGVWCANVSHVNESYWPVNNVLEYKYDEETRTVEKLSENFSKEPD